MAKKGKTSAKAKSSKKPTPVEDDDDELDDLMDGVGEDLEDESDDDDELDDDDDSEDTTEVEGDDDDELELDDTEEEEAPPPKKGKKGAKKETSKVSKESKTDDKKSSSDKEKKKKAKEEDSESIEGLNKMTKDSGIITFNAGSGSQGILLLIAKLGFDREKVLKAATSASPKMKKFNAKHFSKCDPAKKYGKLSGIIKKLQEAGYKLPK